MGDAEAFLTQRFERGPHRWHDPAGFADLLSLADADAAITGSGLRLPAVRLVRGGEVIDTSLYTRRARTGSHTIHDLTHPGRVLGLFADGATVVLQSLQRWWPAVSRFCRALEAEVGHPVQANAYLTPSGATGLAPHHDTHDVFVLQVHGTKHWTLRAPVVEAPLARHRSDHDRAGAQPVIDEVDLHPGDSLYLPRGFVHSASAQEGVSLHLTVGVLATTVHDLLVRIVERAAEVPAFRRSLPPATSADPAAAVDAVGEAVAGLVRWLEQLDLEAVAGDLVGPVAGRRHPLLHGQLLQLARLDELDDASVVRVRSGTVSHLDRVEGALRVSLGDRELDLPAALGPAVARVLDGAPHTVGDLADLLDARSRAVFVRRLVREGAVEVVGHA